MKAPGLIRLAFLLCSVGATAQADLSTHANAFLKLLDEEQRKLTVFEYEHGERVNWNFVPTSRRGLAFAEMNETQKAAAISLLKATLSDQGFRKASGVLSLESILREVEGRSEGDSYRDPGKYYVTIFGTPNSSGLWGWRIEGHHISVNASSENGRIVALTPSFFGANPAIVPKGTERGKQVLKDETDWGFRLVNSLDKLQLEVARFSDRALPEIASGNRRNAVPLEPRGILFKNLSGEQQKIFLSLLEVFVLNYEFGFSGRLMKKITDAGIDNLSFAWAGSLQPGSGHYYRLQGPMLLVEYDNTQNNANHVHTVVRDLTNDFAEDILREHYAKDHK